MRQLDEVPFLLSPWGAGASRSPYAIQVEPGHATVARGADQTIVAHLEGFDSDWQELISDLVHVGDRVAVRTVWHGVGHGPELKQESTPVFTVRRGRVFHIEFFWNHAEALEALGRSE